jgi:hypothetical protein
VDPGTKAEIGAKQAFYKSLASQYASADKPNQYGITPSADQVKARRAGLQTMMDQTLDEIHGLSSKGQQQTNQPLQTGRILTPDQARQGAQPGDIVQKPDGSYIQMGQDKTWNHYSGQVPAQPAPPQALAPQAAPQQQSSPLDTPEDPIPAPPVMSTMDLGQ